MNVQQGFERIATHDVTGAAYSEILGLLTVCFSNEMTMYVRVEEGRLLVEFDGPTIQ